LEKEVKGKNKKMLRLLQERINSIDSMLKTRQQLTEQQQHLLGSLDHLAHGSYFPLYSSKYQLLANEWKQLQETSNNFEQQWFDFFKNPLRLITEETTNKV